MHGIHRSVMVVKGTITIPWISPPPPVICLQRRGAYQRDSSKAVACMQAVWKRRGMAGWDGLSWSSCTHRNTQGRLHVCSIKFTLPSIPTSRNQRKLLIETVANSSNLLCSYSHCWLHEVSSMPQCWGWSLHPALWTHLLSTVLGSYVERQQENLPSV